MKNHLSLLRIEELLFLAFSFATLFGKIQDRTTKKRSSTGRSIGKSF
jgi:hypothetical protein